MRRAAVVFPVQGSPTVRNSVGCLIITRFPPTERIIFADIRSWHAIRARRLLGSCFVAWRSDSVSGGGRTGPADDSLPCPSMVVAHMVVGGAALLCGFAAINSRRAVRRLLHSRRPVMSAMPPAGD